MASLEIFWGGSSRYISQRLAVELDKEYKPNTLILFLVLRMLSTRGCPKL